jgi:hypothetical protein
MSKNYFFTVSLNTCFVEKTFKIRILDLNEVCVLNYVVFLCDKLFFTNT